MLTLLHLQVASEGGNVCLELALIHFKVFQLLRTLKSELCFSRILTRKDKNSAHSNIALDFLFVCFANGENAHPSNSERLIKGSV